ncbi:PRC-barrel domain-containing protein [Phenylobacterium sp.]|uniref:PRC-barrel domain-containing protein n=1 Tax=Phenylobacterium sp. TaxID=1871053 RepID=UPI0025EB884D|nr:PRC-barrel domain-containing protein [Phenylobacterium sp.]MBX3484569.1 PRC-barrel domain-containing protein [Phenylobacterium sp.]MCW5759686.1 PRC-barrel domain-containing protein [Phenylobacterium sp.]
MTARKPAHPLIPADRVNGTDVVNKAGDKLGKIEDVAIEKVSGEVAYAILSFGGLLGLGAKYHPVPWKLLKYDADRRAYVVPMEKADLETAPMIDETELSGWTDEATRDAIFKYYGAYGVGPYWM